MIVNHVIQITLTILLAVTHAAVLPVHVAIDHHRVMPHETGTGSLTHEHDHEDGLTHHHDDHDTEKPGRPDSSGVSEHDFPDQNDVHAHSVTDHSLYRDRSGSIHNILPTLIPVLDRLVFTKPFQPIEVRVPPPISAPCLSFPSLRGPPFC